MSGGRCRVLVTGFEPFGGSTLNPSQRVAESVGDLLTDAGDAIDLRGACLPVDTRKISGLITSLWAEHEPEVVLHFGESAKADCVTLERVALNLLDFDTPDNTGQRITDQPIDPQGPAARFVTLPVRELQRGLETHGIKSRLSLSAGAYLCNQALYLSLAEAETRGGHARVGFVHVPSLPEQAARGERSGPTLAEDALLAAAAWLIRLSAKARN